ncbi:MAG TPA: PAS domain-containing protein [Acidimicrobiales bacterium]|nr:PAS domain-containing protein [Acidimicrobiales bacterium]
MTHNVDLTVFNDQGNDPPDLEQRATGRPPGDPTVTAAAALELVPVPLMVVGPDGRVLLANDAFCAVMGTDALAGRPARFVSHAPAWQRIWRLVTEPPAGGPGTVGVEDASGHRRFFEVVVAPLAQADATLVSLREVTVVRALRQQLSAQSRLLAAAKLQLRAARDELQRSEEQFGRVVAELEAHVERDAARQPETA